MIVCPFLVQAIQLYWNFKLYVIYFSPKSVLPNWACGLSKDAAYTQTFTVFTWVDYNSFPFMAFNREPLVDFKYPLLALLSWFPFMGFIHFTSGLYCIYLHEWIIIPSHSWLLIENNYWLSNTQHCYYSVDLHSWQRSKLRPFWSPWRVEKIFGD